MIFNNGLWEIKKSTAWQNGETFKRVILAQNTALIITKYFNSDILQRKLFIHHLDKPNCGTKDEFDPCTRPDRTRICLPANEGYWCQFAHQLAHELCHCTTSTKTLPQKVKWFDEFLCCFTSYFSAMKLSTEGDKFLACCYPNYQDKFANYTLIEQPGHIYKAFNTRLQFGLMRSRYEADQNLIKKHDFYYLELYNKLNGFYNGLTVVSKIAKLKLQNDCNIEQLFELLSTNATTDELTTLQIISNIFGLTTCKTKLQDGEIA